MNVKRSAISSNSVPTIVCRTCALFVCLLIVVAQGLPSSTANGDVVVQFVSTPVSTGFVYSWDSTLLFEDPDNPIANILLLDPAGNQVSSGFGNYDDFRNLVEGTWMMDIEYDDGNMASVEFEISNTLSANPFATPVVLSPNNAATIMSGQAFFPDLDAATATSSGFLSRTRFFFPEGTAEFVAGGDYNGFRATLDPAFSEAEFEYRFTNVDDLAGFVNVLSGDDTIIETDVQFTTHSERRSVNISSIPEPSSAAVISGLALLALLGRRRNRSK